MGERLSVHLFGIIWLFFFYPSELISVLIGLVLQLSMASLIGREWTGLQQFPAATQTKLLELLSKLKQEVGFSLYLVFSACTEIDLLMELK